MSPCAPRPGQGVQEDRDTNRLPPAGAPQGLAGGGTNRGSLATGAVDPGRCGLGETPAWPSAPGTGAPPPPRPSFHAGLAHLPARPLLIRGPHWERPRASQHQLGRPEWGGVSPISQSTQSATPVLPSEEALRGDRTELAWGRLLSKVTPKRPPLPHPILGTGGHRGGDPDIRVWG